MWAALVSTSAASPPPDRHSRGRCPYAFSHGRKTSTYHSPPVCGVRRRRTSRAAHRRDQTSVRPNAYNQTFSVIAPRLISTPAYLAYSQRPEPHLRHVVSPCRHGHGSHRGAARCRGRVRIHATHEAVVTKSNQEGDSCVLPCHTDASGKGGCGSSVAARDRIARCRGRAPRIRVLTSHTYVDDAIVSRILWM